MLIFIIILFVILIGITIFIVDYAFKNLVLAKRQTKEDAFNLLKTKGIYNIEDYNSLDIEELNVKSNDGYKLKGYFIEKDKDCKKVMIIIHGYTANHFVSLQFVDMFLKDDFNVLLIDARSHGSSEGVYASYGFYERDDLDLWVDLIRSKIGSDGKIGLMGQSMGASTVLMYGGAHEDKIDFIIEDCGFSNGKEILKYQLKKVAHLPCKPFYYFINRRLRRKCLFSLDDVSPIDDIKDKEIPVLFIHGTEDGTVPFSMGEEMFKIKKGNKNIFYKVEGAVHVGCYPKDKEKYKEAVYNFINLALKD